MEDNREKGMTLVEVLASLVLLSIIIISFLAIFPTVAKQNKASDEVMDATYIAQTTMEEIIQIKTNSKTFEAADDVLVNGKYIRGADSDTYVSKENNNQLYKVLIYFSKPNSDRSLPSNTSRVIVKVFKPNDEINSKPRAQMETILWWEEGQ